LCNASQATVAVRTATVNAIATFPEACISQDPKIDPDLIRIHPKHNMTANTSGKKPQSSGAIHKIAKCGRRKIHACTRFAQMNGSLRDKLPAMSPRNNTSSVKPVFTTPYRSAAVKLDTLNPRPTNSRYVDPGRVSCARGGGQSSPRTIPANDKTKL
jgi:hypothetical protein